MTKDEIIESLERECASLYSVISEYRFVLKYEPCSEPEYYTQFIEAIELRKERGLALASIEQDNQQTGSGYIEGC